MKNAKEILIIDDDSKNIFALSAVLKAKKFQCVSAISAGQGLQMLSSNKNIGVVLMDMMMPEMDGYEAIGKIKNDEHLKNIPVIAITAQAMTGDREKCIEAGADGYISKPVDVNELLLLLNQLID
ncbi:MULTISPECIES: response regulator [unclassified Kaistella]|uniref:response regulator n=1 Tax=unclassified Kaistella TaxID=2762626 RepID=UPI002732621A|nr:MULTISPECIES: response regulator [unclassified Kaistella]MCZ2085482.1 response regulator [Flavobacteriales bacterium]MDP2453540.1 response regulator [Kaistella sp. SH11-4b]MDP2456597.1 response regulator [Kaistella sp. SH40-3]MDP2459353.1 response regulator [Kaistella sp. SH19-2b]